MTGCGCDVEARSNSTPSRSARLAVLGICVVLTGVLFVLARQLDWTRGWIYVGLLTSQALVNLVCVALWNPVVLRRRGSFAALRGVKIWDILWSVLTVLGAVAVYVVFAGDLGTPAGGVGPPGLVWLIGATIFVSGWILFTWSMIANPFFEKTVRIQREHGHRVIDSGTYAYVRHPGYVGFSAMCLSTPVLLWSVPTALPIAVLELLLVIRTLLEDRMLQAELPGYAEYATKVRFRLIPRVW